MTRASGFELGSDGPTTPIAFGDDGIILGAIATANLQLMDELELAIQTLSADYHVRAKFISKPSEAMSFRTRRVKR